MLTLSCAPSLVRPHSVSTGSPISSTAVVDAPSGMTGPAPLPTSREMGWPAVAESTHGPASKWIHPVASGIPGELFSEESEFDSDALLSSMQAVEGMGQRVQADSLAAPPHHHHNHNHHHAYQ